jgi:formamidopyrimidine-DNA glycosylase
VFRAGIHPKRKAGSLGDSERRALYDVLKETLEEAVRLGGKDDVHDLYGRQGGYRKVLGAHVLGEPCPRCGVAIEKLGVAGSNTYLCPSCQSM